MTFVSSNKIKRKNYFISTNGEVTIFEFAVVSALALVGFLFFTYSDIIVTAERSFLLLNGRISDFYSSAELYTGGGANYMPTTFIIFAIWNLPLKLLGLAPAAFGESGTLQILWYKLLPILVYLLSVILVYQIVHRRLGAEIKKAKIIAFCYASFPISIFSQFIFCQYDIFTVVFMLLGLWYFFAENQRRKDKTLFCLYFAIAITCKYQALAIFAVLVVLREKRILKIIEYALGSVSLLFAEALICSILDGGAFKRQVLEFGVLDYTNSSMIGVGVGDLSILGLFLCLLVAWAYFTMPATRDEFINYVFFFCCGVCFALFVLMPWHPQWLLFGAFFWCVSSCKSKYYRFFMFLDGLWAVTFVIFVVNRWYRWIDQAMFSGGILGNLLSKQAIDNSMAMAEIYRTNSTIISIIYTIVAASILVNFIFKHPRYCERNWSGELSAGPATARFLLGILSFMIPAFYCLTTML